MVKGKKIMIITIGLVSFILTLVMSMQFKVILQTDIAQIDIMRKVELEEELANIKSKNKEVSDTLIETKIKITEYQEVEKSNEDIEELLANEYDYYQTITGVTDVIGEGIILTIEDTLDNTVTADDLILLVNDLKEAGAEAIAINGERIMSMTDIVYINGAFIKINGERVLSPYEIKAIGNQSHLESILTGKGSYGERLSQLEYNILVEKYEELMIGKYNKDIIMKYIN